MIIRQTPRFIGKRGVDYSFGEQKSELESGTYRIKSVFTLTDKNGKTETITVYSDEKSV